MTDIFKSTPHLARLSQKKDLHDVDEDYRDLLPLPLVLQTCVYLPLQAQATIVNHSLLNFFLIDCQLEQHFNFIRDHFFLQDGEFSQRLTELLFQRVSTVKDPVELLNSVTLNSVMSKSYSYCSWAASPRGTTIEETPSTSEQQNNLSFAVKFVPATFQLDSPGVLDCLRLVYRTKWPCNIVFSSEASKYYESIFSFLLQLRYCLWALLEAYHFLKEHSPHSSASSYHHRHYRLLQLYRQEMHHFMRSLQEYLNLQAFQITYCDFHKNLMQAASLDDLIAMHIKYLQKISFRCFLQNKATPLMKILRNILAVILTFCAQLKPSSDDKFITDEEMSGIQVTYKKFKEDSCYLFQVLISAVHKGYNPPLREFLMRLDYNGHFTSTLLSEDQQLPS